MLLEKDTMTLWEDLLVHVAMLLNDNSDGDEVVMGKVPDETLFYLVRENLGNGIIRPNEPEAMSLLESLFRLEIKRIVLTGKFDLSITTFLETLSKCISIQTILDWLESGAVEHVKPKNATTSAIAHPLSLMGGLCTLPFRSLSINLIQRAATQNVDSALRVVAIDGLVQVLLYIWLCTRDIGISEQTGKAIIKLLQADLANGKNASECQIWRKFFYDETSLKIILQTCDTAQCSVPNLTQPDPDHANFFQAFQRSTDNPQDLTKLNCDEVCQGLNSQNIRSTSRSRLITILPVIAQMDWKTVTKPFAIRDQNSNPLASLGCRFLNLNGHGKDSRGLLQFALCHDIDGTDWNEGNFDKIHSDVLTLRLICHTLGELIAHPESIKNKEYLAEIPFLDTADLGLEFSKQWKWHDNLCNMFYKSPDFTLLTSSDVLLMNRGISHGEQNALHQRKMNLQLLFPALARYVSLYTVHHQSDALASNCIDLTIKCVCDTAKRAGLIPSPTQNSATNSVPPPGNPGYRPITLLGTGSFLNFREVWQIHISLLQFLPVSSILKHTELLPALSIFPSNPFARETLVCLAILLAADNTLSQNLVLHTQYTDTATNTFTREIFNHFLTFPFSSHKDTQSLSSDHQSQAYSLLQHYLQFHDNLVYQTLGEYLQKSHCEPARAIATLTLVLSIICLYHQVGISKNLISQESLGSLLFDLNNTSQQSTTLRPSTFQLHIIQPLLKSLPKFYRSSHSTYSELLYQFFIILRRILKYESSDVNDTEMPDRTFSNTTTNSPTSPGHAEQARLTSSTDQYYKSLTQMIDKTFEALTLQNSSGLPIAHESLESNEEVETLTTE